MIAKKLKNIIRNHFSIELRLLREALNIYIYKKLNIKGSSIGPKEFPIGLTGSVSFYTHPFLENNDNKYFSQIYGANNVTDTTIHQRGYLHFISEILNGDMHETEYAFTTSEDVFIPVSIPDKNSDSANGQLTVGVNDGLIEIKKVKKNRFNYLSFPANKNITINSPDKIIVGRPIVKRDNKPENKKLVVSIFIDGLASEIFNREDFSSLMPNTSNYFSDGLMFFNCYANANWTLPSVPSIVSGLYPINHKVYNSKLVQHIGDGYSVLSEYFQENGYLTCQIDNVMRKSPIYNYAKGFDRTLYKIDMSCKDVIMHAIEHLTAFNERDNYLWISLFELHHNLYGVPDISTQTHTPLHIYGSKTTKSKSPFASYDKKSIERYILELKRLDIYLGIFYDFLKKKYKNDDVVVSIISDHGQSYLGQDEERLAEYKIKVPMMFKSSDVGSATSDEMIENIDYLPALLKASGLSATQNLIDGRLPNVMGGEVKKEFVISEDIHENSKYYAAVYGIEYMLFVESVEIIDNIVDIDLMSCRYKLLHRESNVIIDSGLCSDPSKASYPYILFLKKHKRNL